MLKQSPWKLPRGQQSITIFSVESFVLRCSCRQLNACRSTTMSYHIDSYESSPGMSSKTVYMNGSDDVHETYSDRGTDDDEYEGADLPFPPPNLWKTYLEDWKEFKQDVDSELEFEHIPWPTILVPETIRDLAPGDLYSFLREAARQLEGKTETKEIRLARQCLKMWQEPPVVMTSSCKFACFLVHEIGYAFCP